MTSRLGTGKSNKLFPARESLVSDIPAGDGKSNNLFLQCTVNGVKDSRLNTALYLSQ